MKHWYTLDHAGKLYSIISNDFESSMIRVSMIIKSPVNVSVLQQAVNLVMKRFPTMAVKLDRGFFWNFLCENKNQLTVKPETAYPCAPIRPSENDEFIMRILYYKSKITAEFSHVLTDATGAIEFLKTLVFQYLVLQGEEINDDEGIILPPDSFPNYTEDQNSYESYYSALKSKEKRPGRFQSIDTEKAYKIKGTQFAPYGHHIIHGTVSLSALHDIVKKRNCTISAYLVSVLYLAINNNILPDTSTLRPIIIGVPVNLRKRFPSYSLRNFSTVVHIRMPISRGTSFEDILNEISGQLAEKTEKNNLAKVFANTISLEKKLPVHFMPLFIKKHAFRIGYRLLGEETQTISFSNLGKIELPKTMSPYVNAVEAAVSPSIKDPIFCFVYSLEDNLTISFSRSILEGNIIREFFKILSKQSNLDIHIISNEWEMHK